MISADVDQIYRSGWRLISINSLDQKMLVLAGRQDVELPWGGQLRVAYKNEPQYVISHLIKIAPHCLSVAPINVASNEEAVTLVATGLLDFCVTSIELAESAGLVIHTALSI